MLVAFAVLFSSLLPASASASVQQIPKTLIDPAIWPNFTRYAQFSACSKSQPCPSPPFGSIVLEYINETFTDTQATVLLALDRKEIVVTFPGTQSDMDRYTDLNYTLVPYVGPGIPKSDCADCKTHAGFLLAYDSIAQQLNDTLTKAAHDYPEHAVILTGHSLGGALAAFAYIGLKTLGQNVTGGYTFGEPRIGNAAFADYFDKITGATNETIGEFFRSTHTFDGAPDLPPQILGYRHHGTEFWELDAPYGIAAQAANRTYRCYGQEPTDCSNSQQASNFQGQGYNNAAHNHYAGIVFNDNDTFTYCGLDSQLPGTATATFTNITTRDVKISRLIRDAVTEKLKLKQFNA